ncbi:MAG: MarR family transcriptional regulator [Lachnospiraceae bacterium]|nr:MarR family transcriptional regulator [Lachnospiraceae bacterium]
MDEFEECVCDEAQKYKLGHVIRGLHGAFGKKFMACGMAVGLDEVTLMHGWIMGYLYRNQERAVYQKTIESNFNIRRSTVTAILQLMEKKGYIKRSAVEGDARLKQISLTDQGMAIAIKTKAMIDNMESTILEGIEPERLEIFYEVAQKLMTNMNQ